MRISAKDQTRGDLDRAKKSISTQLGGLQQIVTTGLAGAAGVGIIGNFLRIAAAAEQSNIAFNTIIKDMDRTKQLIQELNTFSVKTPFEPVEVRKAGQDLLAFQNAVEDIPTIIKFLGDTAAGTGARLGELVLVFNKIKAAGKLTGETFLQLAERGANVQPVLADMLGKTTAEIQEMQRKGQISFDLVVKAFQKMTGEGGIFFGAMEKQSESLTGKLSTLTGGFNDVKEQIGTALLPIAKQITSVFIRIVDAFSAVNRASGGLVAKITGIVAVIGTATAAIASITLAASALGITMAGVTAALGTAAGIVAPLLAIAAVIGVVVAGMVQFVRWVRQVPGFAESWASATDRLRIAWDRLAGMVGMVRDRLLQLGEVFRPFATQVLSWLRTVRDTFGTVIVLMVDGVSQFALTAVNAMHVILESWSAGWDAIGRAMQAALTGNFDEAERIMGAQLAAMLVKFGNLQAQTQRDLQRLRDLASKPIETGGIKVPGVEVGTVKATIEFPRGMFGIEDLSAQFQRRELERDKDSKKVVKNTGRSADSLEKIEERIRGGDTVSFATADE